jgi:L-alanine-DL-glutamate epimerase-like enolase superfamily enzyme
LIISCNLEFNPMPTLTYSTETWPIDGTFTISRGSSTQTDVIVVEIRDGSVVGRGECYPFRRYGESIASVSAQLDTMVAPISDGLTRQSLQTAMPSGAARNAIDCALWDLESRRTKTPIANLTGLQDVPEIITAYTISLATPEVMAAQAKDHSTRPLLKVKLGGDGDDERMAAVRQAAPDTRLIADANEAWSLDHLRRFPQIFQSLDVELIEQPLPEADDGDLAKVDSPLPICADESFKNVSSLSRLRGLYQAINIKLDKTGGLTEAIKALHAAQDEGYQVLTGCMVTTSLSMAPARYLAGAADWADLDGPLLLARDRTPGLTYTQGRIAPVPSGLWGYTETNTVVGHHS